MSAKNAVDEEKKLLSKMAEEREGDKGSMKPATAAPEDGGTSKADSTGTGADKKPTVADAVAETKNQTKKPDEKNDDDEKSKPDGSSVTDGNSQPDGAAGRDNGNAEKPKAAATETAGKGRNGAKKPATTGEEDAEEGAGGGAGKKSTAGKSLGAIAQIDANINSAKVDDLQTLHTILYDGPAKAMVLRRNLRKFDGFEFGADSDAYRKRVSATEKLDVKKLAQLAHVLALEKKGTKEELAARICTFLLKPDGEEELSADELGEEEEEDEDEEEEEEVSEEEEAPKKKTPARRGGAAAATPTRGRDNASSKSTSGRPKRTTAGRGYQDNSLYVDYSSSEEEEEETVKVGRGRRARRGSDSGSDYNPSAGSDSDAGKRRSSRAPARGSRTSARNVRKRYSDDESEESASDEDFSEDDRRKKKTTPARGGRGRPSAAAAASRQSQRGRGRKRKAETESEEEESEEEEVDSEDSDRPKRKSVAKTGGRAVAANNKAKNVAPVKGRGQPKRAAAVNSAKKTKRGRGRSSSGDEEDEEDEEDAEEEEEEDEPELEENESEDEKPLVKKAKQEKEVVDAAAPPSEDDIKEYLKEILEEANLEEITMKTVCKKVYAKYPEHDLSHKKDFIKATVKSLIST